MQIMSFQISKALSQSVGISARMINRQDSNFIPLHCEANFVFEPMENCFAHISRNLRKTFRRMFNPFKEVFDLLFELATQSRLPFFQIIDSCGVVQICWRLEIQSPHFQPCRLRTSSRTCSQGIPDFGFFLKSSALRSSSAISSGIKSMSCPFSARSSRSFWVSSICSSNGRAFAALNNSVALMLQTYDFMPQKQVASFAAIDS
jgi:hypothetical protein